MQIRDAVEADGAAIAGIYNDAVQHTTATWHTATVDAADRRAWMATRRAAGFPVLVVDDDGGVVGYASYGDWRTREGYRHTVEHSVYVRADRRGQGLGRTLLERLIDHARAAGMHVMVAGIGAENTGSIALHVALGFTEVGRMPQVGAKFGRWLDLVFLQLQLDDRAAPDD